MPDDANESPARREPEAQEIDLEFMDEGAGAPGGMSPADLLQAAPEMMVQVFRGMLKERLKGWCIRNLVAVTIFQEHGWVRVLFYIWAFIQGIYLAFLLYGWYAAGKQASKLAQVLGGLNPRGPDMRE